jgi:hypothetical protein
MTRRVPLGQAEDKALVDKRNMPFANHRASNSNDLDRSVGMMMMRQ